MFIIEKDEEEEGEKGRGKRRGRGSEKRGSKNTKRKK